MSPCCHGLANRVGSIACESVTTSDPARIMTRTPGHHAANPAKNPQNGPRALWVHTYSEPSSGNIRPSCAVTKAPGMRNVRNPRIQNTNVAGPANCTVEAFGMNKTRATKITTRSNDVSTLPTRVGATFSEIISRSPVMSAAMKHPPRKSWRGPSPTAPAPRGAECEAHAPRQALDTRPCAISWLACHEHGHDAIAA